MAANVTLRKLVAAALLLTPAGCLSLLAQTRITLQQAGSRSGNDFTPTYDGQEVLIKGQVASAPVWAVDSYYVALRDDADYGLLLFGPANQFQGLNLGDWLEVHGTVSRRAGLPVLLPAEIHKLSSQPPPAPRRVKLADLTSFRYLGMMVTTEGVVSTVSESSAGEVINIGDRSRSLNVYLPKARRQSSPGLGNYRIGDRIRVTGLATQYSPIPPYDRSFQLLIADASAVSLVERGWLIPPLLLLTALCGIVFVLVIWWLRERRMAKQRNTLRTLNGLGEEIIAASSPAEILNKLSTVVIKVAHATDVRLYLYNRRTKSLDQVTGPNDPRPVSINVDLPKEGLATGAAVCFRNRVLLNVPDTRRSPLIKASAKGDLPRSVMFVPMFAQTELVGVLELDHAESLRYFNQEEQAAAQHLANQVATSLKLQEQQSIREQLFRSEKLAATGQLISGVASELSAPLKSIVKLSTALAVRAAGGLPERDLRVLAAEAQRAAEIVNRLVSFAKAEDSTAKKVEVNSLVAGLLQFRTREWQALELELVNHLAEVPVYVLGAQGQLEQVFLNLLIHAEQSVADSADKTITVCSSLLARRVLVEISYASRSGESPFFDPFAEGRNGDAGSLGLGVCRGIVQSHGGEIRYARPSDAASRFEVELPLADSKTPSESGSRIEATRGARALTVLLVEPDASVQKQLVSLLSARGHRVVPMNTAEEAADLVQRLRFDATICSIKLPGLNWVEFFERVRSNVGAFVLITDGYDPELVRAFQDGEGYLLSRPIEVPDLERILKSIEEGKTAEVRR